MTRRRGRHWRRARVRLLCRVFGHKWPLRLKYDGGRRPWLCRRCSAIVGYGEVMPSPTRRRRTGA